MSSPSNTYNKQNSFLDIRHHKTLEDIFPQIRHLKDTLHTLSLSDYKKSIVQSACTELLDEATLDKGVTPFQLFSYNLDEISQLVDEDLPRYLFYRYRYETFPQRLQLDDFPPCLQIEPASICNYRCLFCYQIDEEFTRKSNGMMGMMSLDLFKQIIDQAEGRCEAITLASRGEPLICPDFESMIRYAGGKFLALKLNTNAWFLDEKMCHAILEAGVSTVVFSADAASEPTYSKLRVNGSLQRVYENIKLFREIRDKHFPESKVITRVSGVKVPGTDKLEDMENFWGELVDQVAFVKYNPWENSYDQSINDTKEPCSDLWRRMFVWWDGKVNPCDVDFKSHLSTGNALSQDLSDLWQSSAYMALREKHKEKLRSQCEPCNRCTFI
jgi:radical SAM protein with 4Fe4S-binding SPASM domain